MALRAQVVEIRCSKQGHVDLDPGRGSVHFTQRNVKGPSFPRNGGLMLRSLPRGPFPH